MATPSPYEFRRAYKYEARITMPDGSVYLEVLWAKDLDDAEREGLMLWPGAQAITYECCEHNPHDHE